jgi:hypothetical protein
MFHDFAEREKESLSLLKRRLGKVSVGKTLPPPSQSPQVPSQRAEPPRFAARMRPKTDTLGLGSPTQKHHPDVVHKKPPPPLPSRPSKLVSMPSPVQPAKPSFEGYLFTLLDPVQLGEEVSWTKIRKAKLRASSQEIFDKATSHGKKTGWTCAQQLQALDWGQQALVQRLLADKNADKGEHTVEWTLFGVQKLYEERKAAFRTSKLNYAIRVTIKRGDMAILAEDARDKNSGREITSERMSKARGRETIDLKVKKNVAATDSEAGRPTSSSNDMKETSPAPTFFPSDLLLNRKRSGDFEFQKMRGTSSAGAPLLPNPNPASLHLEQDDEIIFGGEYAESALDLSTLNMSLHRWDRIVLHGTVPDIQNELQDLKHKTNVRERRKSLKAFLDRERGYKAMKQPGGRNDNSADPLRKLRRSVNDLGVSVQDASTSEQTMSDEETRPESVEVTLRDADTEVSGSQHWKTSSAGKARVTEAKDTSRARTSPHDDDHEASLSGKPSSTQIGTAPKDESPVHDDISHLGIPVARSSWSLEHGADLSGYSQLSKNIARFLISTNVLFASLFGIGIHDTSGKQLNVWWYVVLGVVSVLLAAIAYLAYIHPSLKTSGNSGGTVEGHDDKETQMPHGSDLRDFFCNSEAYNTSRSELFDVAHEMYEKRILSAIGRDLEQAGVRLEKDVTHYTGREISWVPVHYLTFSDDASLSYADTMKAAIEERMGESWNWWPLAPRLHQLRPGYCRLQWKSVCGSSSFLSSDTIQLTAYKSHAEPFATSIFRRVSRTLCNKLSKLRLPSSTLTFPLANAYTRRAGIVAVK